MKHTQLLRTMIVDDEPLARTAIRNMLSRHDGVEIVCDCESGKEAITAIETMSPDIVFLDVQMPEVDGFMVLEAVSKENMPGIVFVTAYDEYAVRAFKVHALDYLLKPFDRDRFDAALEHVKNQLARGEMAEVWKERISALIRESRGKFLDRLIVRSEGRVFFLPVREIDWIEAQGNYVNLHGRGRSYLLREAIGSLEGSLDPRRFRRIHRSSIINIDSVRELRLRFHGDYDVILSDGTELKLSHRYRANLERDFKGSL
jgi:two-component system, LytTR family, response regulator